MYFTPHLESKLYRGHATSFIEAEPKDEMHPVGIQYSTHTCSINNLFISIRAVVYGFISELDLHIFVDLLCCLPCQVLGIRWTVSLTERLAPVLNWKPCEQASVWTSVYFSFSQCRRRNLLHVWANRRSVACLKNCSPWFWVWRTCSKLQKSVKIGQNQPWCPWSYRFPSSQQSTWTARG